MVLEAATASFASTRSEAATQLARIKNHWQTFWFELRDFHARQNWIPLGYTSFRACVEQELGLSERRAYQLLDAASIRAELDTEHVFSIASATEGQLRQLKPLAPEQRLELARQIDFANTSVREVREIAQEVRNPAHVSYNSGNNEWYTPAEYITAARRVLRCIDLDPASSVVANQIVQATTYHTVETDGLAQNWCGAVWMNPPYASDLIGRFVDKLVGHFRHGEVTEAIVLVNNATETVWYQALDAAASGVCFPRGRVRFIDASGSPSGAPLQGQSVLYLGAHPGTFIREFAGFGSVWGRGQCARGHP